MQVRLPFAASRRAYYFLAAVFLLSRIIIYALGIRFDSTTLATFWQFLDPKLLQERLLESLWYLHSQPPIYNLFLGIVLKISPVHYTALFHGIYLLLGFWLASSLYQLLRHFEFSERTAVILASLFMLTPVSIVFENWLFYDYPLAAIFAAMALAFLKFMKNGKTRDAAFFFTLLLVVVLMRSLFHAVWVVAVTGLMFYLARDHRRALIRGAMVPLAIISLFYSKNMIQFGSMAGSTWFGQHLSRVTTAEIDENVRKDLVERGVLTPAALIPAFTHLVYYNSLGLTKSKTGIPALDDERKASDFQNFNNAEYIQISELYKKDALYVAAHYPGVLATSIVKSSFFYLRSPGEFYMLRVPNAKLGLYEKLFRGVVYGELAEYPNRVNKGQPGYQKQMLLSTPWIMLFLLPATLVFGGRRAVQAWKNRKHGFSATDSTMLFVGFTLLFVSVIANIFEMGENNRIRFMIDPFFMLVGCVMIRDGLAYLRSHDVKAVVLARLPKPKNFQPNFSRGFRLW